jgi:hypothetical protein
VAELGDMRFDCPACDERLTIPVRQRTHGKFTIGLAVDFGVLRGHLATAHPELAEQTGEAVTGEQPAEPGELFSPGR